MVRTAHTREEVMEILSQIPDPEIPVVNIREMGMLHDVVVDDTGYEVQLMPTYTGCPAMSLIEQDILATLHHNKVGPAKVKMIYTPAWNTDMMTAGTREKLRAYGIAPPVHSSQEQREFHHNEIACPHCGSTDTVPVSRFGSTACKALYTCNDCKEPFEYFKCHV